MPLTEAEPVAPPSGPKIDAFFAKLAPAARRLLLLDYDGTLAPFQVDPASAEPYAGVREVLDAIMHDPRTQVVIVSGRPARDIWPLLNLARRPVVWGSHGWEVLDADGEYRCGPLDARSLRVALHDGVWVERAKQLGGRVEIKPGSIAVHWRGVDAARIPDIRHVVREHWLAHARDWRLTWTDFDGGVEMRVPGRDKGYVIESLLTAYPNAVAAYLGDDLTDEDAFKALKDAGLSVLVRASYRPTVAHAWLRPPEQLLEFLERWRAVGRKTAQ
ncbi:MAG: trehalose-phosphatase [Gammaproteobacteria bacterium]